MLARYVSLEQGTPEWERVRREEFFLTASEAAIVLGLSKRMSRYRLFETKTGRCQPPAPTPWAQQMLDSGKACEPVIFEALERSEFILEGTMRKTGIWGKWLSDECLVGASPDGIAFNCWPFAAPVCVEIKTTCFNIHEGIDEVKYPLQDLPQVAMQMMCTGYDALYARHDGLRTVHVWAVERPKGPFWFFEALKAPILCFHAACQTSNGPSKRMKSEEIAMNGEMMRQIKVTKLGTIDCPLHDALHVAAYQAAEIRSEEDRGSGDAGDVKRIR